MNWGLDEDIIPGVAREYVSIEWSGYLLPPETGDYLFFIEGDDGFRLYIGDEVQIDNLVDVDETGNPHRITSS